MPLLESRVMQKSPSGVRGEREQLCGGHGLRMVLIQQRVFPWAMVKPVRPSRCNLGVPSIQGEREAIAYRHERYRRLLRVKARPFAVSAMWHTARNYMRFGNLFGVRRMSRGMSRANASSQPIKLTTTPIWNQRG